MKFYNSWREWLASHSQLNHASDKMFTENGSPVFCTLYYLVLSLYQKQESDEGHLIVRCQKDT